MCSVNINNFSGDLYFRINHLKLELNFISSGGIAQ